MHPMYPKMQANGEWMQGEVARPDGFEPPTLESNKQPRHGG